MLPYRRRWATVAIALMSLTGCAESGGDSQATAAAQTDTSVTTGAGGAPASSNANTSSGVGAGFGSGGAQDGSMPPGPYLIFAHTDTTLFKLDPTSSNLTLTTIGDFDCIGSTFTSMNDFAVNAKLELWGVSATAIHPLSIQGTTVHCGDPILIQQQNVRFYGLTFAPAGVLDPSEEVLVAGNTAGELWAIDAQGNLQQHGSFGLVPHDDGNGHVYANEGERWELSGDIVFLANNGNPVGFATVRDCPNPPSTTGCDSVNTLIEIDVAKLGSTTTGSVTKAVRGEIVRASGCNDGTDGTYGNMYGIAAWNDKVYGLSRSGNMVEINTSDGSACLVQAYASDKFAGAGVTTQAPVAPPPPK